MVGPVNTAVSLNAGNFIPNSTVQILLTKIHTVFVSNRFEMTGQKWVRRRTGYPWRIWMVKHTVDILVHDVDSLQFTA